MESIKTTVVKEETVFEPEKTIHIEFKANHKRILFESYFKIIAKNGDKITAVCIFCKSSLSSKVHMCGSLKRHLKVRNI